MGGGDEYGETSHLYIFTSLQGRESSEISLISDFFCSSQNPIFRL